MIQKTADGGNPKPFVFHEDLNSLIGASGSIPIVRISVLALAGLKTSLLTHVQKQELPLSTVHMKDVAASFQKAVADALVRRVARGLERYEVAGFACAGGVSLNRVLREKLSVLSEQTGVPLLLSPPALCTDNAAMIAGLRMNSIDEMKPFKNRWTSLQAYDCRIGKLLE